MNLGETRKRPCMYIDLGLSEGASTRNFSDVHVTVILVLAILCDICRKYNIINTYS